MKMRFAALAVALVATSVGCTAIQTGCGDACGAGYGESYHLSTARMAPRANQLAGRTPAHHGLVDLVGWTHQGCAECVDGCGSCGNGCGLFQRGCGPCGPCTGESCLQGMISTVLDCDGCNGCGDGQYNFQPGPPVGQVAYPYYTTRGPRDFLMCNPPSIGPR